MTRAELIEALADTRVRLERGEDIDVQECEVLVQKVNAFAANASPEDLGALKAGIEGLTAAVHERMGEIDATLKRVLDGRRGVHGYSQLRSHRTAQRLRKRV